MQTIQMQVWDCDYKFLNGKPLVRLFGKTIDGKTICAFYDKLFPYFYLKADESKFAEIKEDLEKKFGAKVEAVKRTLPIGFQEPINVLMITGKDPGDTPEVREYSRQYGTPYEADVLFKYRFLIDKKIKGMCWVEVTGTPTHTKAVKCPAIEAEEIVPIEKIENAPLKYLAFDIECVSDGERIPEGDKDPIIMVSMAFSHEYRGKKALVIVAKNIPNFGDDVISCENEEEMLKKFVEAFNEYDPDIVTGYNINSFDLPYITKRLEILNISRNLGRGDKSIFVKKMQMGFSNSILGRVIVDPFEILKRDPWVTFKRYDLGTVSRELLGMEKLDVGGMREMIKLWRGDPNNLRKFIEYSRRDSVLALKLVIEKEMLDKFFELAKVSGLLLQDVFGGQTQRLDCKLLHEFRDREIIMPCRPEEGEMDRRKKEREEYGLKGAIVLEPKVGLHAQGCILVLDFKSLYPSIMKAFNICPTTLLLNKEENIEHITTPFGSKFATKNVKEGVIPKIISEFLEARSKVKKQMKGETSPEIKRILNAKQLALKTMANSVHPDTFIVIKDPTGEIKITEIEKLFDELKTENKIKKINNIDIIELKNWETLSVDENKSCFKPLYAISRHPNKDRLIKIKTKMGEVKVTKDHSIIEMVGKADNRIRNCKLECLKEKKGNEVNYKTTIAQIRKVDIEDKKVSYFNLLDFLFRLPENETNDLYVFIPKNLNLDKHNWFENRKKLFDYMLKAKTSNLKLLQEELGFDRRIIKNTVGLGIQQTGFAKIGNCGIVPEYKVTSEAEKYLSFYEAFKNVYKNSQSYVLSVKELKNIKIPNEILKNIYIAVGKNAGSGRRKMKALIPVSEELGELFGWFVSEGSTYKRQRGKNISYKAMIANFDKDVLKRIQLLVKNIFNYNANVYGNNVSLNLKLFYLLFRKLCGAGAFEKYIPDFILNSNKSIRKAFLDAYTKGDGDKDGRRLSTVSKKLAAQLSFLLKEEGWIVHNGADSNIFRISKREFSHGNKIVSGDLFGQQPTEISYEDSPEYVYDLSVRGTEKFVTAQGIVLHNSLYGYTGYTRAKLYVLDVANSITAIGRENILNTEKFIKEKFNRDVVAGDSITSNRFITIIDNNNFVKIKNIEKFFEENKDKMKKERGKEIINIKGFKALTINAKNFKSEWKNIKKIIRHKTNKNIFRVNQKFGETVATEDHSIITIEKGKLRETKPEKMNNKIMVRAEKIPKLRQIKEIDLYDILKKYFYESIYKGRRKISKFKADKKHVWFSWTNRKNPIKLKKKIKVDSKEFESLCRLIGAYIPEGSSSTPETAKSRFGASICSEDVEWLVQLQKDYHNLFKDTKSNIIRSSKKIRWYEDKTYKLQMMNNLAAAFFKVLCGQKCVGKKIPEFIFHVPKKYQLIVLENMVKGDGSRKLVGKKRKRPPEYEKKNFRYETKSLQLASGFTFLLQLLNQKYTIRYRKEKGTYIISTCSNYNPIIKTKITQENYEGYVYDLEVEDSHMFVDSCGQVLLHNTDSVFVKVDANDLDEAEKIGNEISKAVTGQLNGLELEFEKIFKTFLIIAKKRYAGWKFEREGNEWKTKIDMKGIETVRRDWCTLVSETMNDVLKIILKEQDVKKASKHVRDVLKDLAEGKVPLEKLTIVKGITKPLKAYGGTNKAGGKIQAPAHVELAKKMVERDHTLGSMVGERIGYIIIKGNQMLVKRAEDPNYIKENGLEIDSQYYVENQLLPPLERIFEACGVERSELVEGSRQKSLFEVLGSRVLSPEQTVLNGFDSVMCNKCNWEFRRPPLRGLCPNCSNGLYFSFNGSLGKFVEWKV